MASISVVIPTYNYGEFIAEALNSVLAQTLPATEVIVVDDGSTDETKNVVLAFGSDVRYIRQENRGVCAARNRGISESNGDFVAFLDADDIWEPTKLEKQAAKFLKDAEIGLVHCGMREFDSRTGATIRMHLEGGEGWLARDIALWEKLVVHAPSMCVVRKDVFGAVGVFDTDLRIGEDWEFYFRVASSFKIGFVREVLVNYRNHGINATKNVAEMERSTTLAWKKVFDSDVGEIKALRSRSYGNLYKVLAGSYLHQGRYLDFFRNVVKSLYFRPSYFGFYISTLWRRS